VALAALVIGIAAVAGIIGLVWSGALRVPKLRTDFAVLQDRVWEVEDDVVEQLHDARNAPAPIELVEELIVERIVVTLRGRNGEKETAFAGLLASVDVKSLVLREAEALTTTGRKKVDGELLLPRAEIAYIQHLTD
jgi:hypothetical protein